MFYYEKICWGINYSDKNIFESSFICFYVYSTLDISFLWSKKNSSSMSRRWLPPCYQWCTVYFWREGTESQQHLCRRMPREQCFCILGRENQSKWLLLSQPFSQPKATSPWFTLAQTSASAHFTKWFSKCSLPQALQSILFRLCSILFRLSDLFYYYINPLSLLLLLLLLFQKSWPMEFVLWN